MKNSVRVVGNVFVIIFLSKVLGQLREMLIASCYGTGDTAAAFTTATQIPLNFFDMILGAAIVSAFVPVFNEYIKKDGFQNANKFANNFIGNVLVVSGVVSVFGVLCSGYLVAIIGSGLEGEPVVLASRLLKIMFPTMILTAVAYSFAGILQSCGEFKAPAAMSVVSNGFTILYLLFFNDRFGIYGLAWSMLIGWTLQILILLPSLMKFHYHFGLTVNFRHPGMKKVYRLVLPVLFSSWGQPINVLLNVRFASYLNNGEAISAINYANRLYLIIASVFTLAVTNYTLPSLSQLHIAGEKKKEGEMVSGSLKAVVLFLMPIIGLFVILRVPIIQVIYGRGQFDELSASLTSTALLFYSFGMIGYGVQEVLNKSFYAMQKSVVPMRTTFLTVGINLILSFLLYRPMGIGGLALAASVAATVGGTVLYFQIRKYNQFVETKSFLFLFLKALAAAVISCFVVQLLYGRLDGWATDNFRRFVMLCGLGIIGIGIYLFLLFLLKVKEIRLLKNLLKKEDI